MEGMIFFGGRLPNNLGKLGDFLGKLGDLGKFGDFLIPSRRPI